MKVWLLRQWLRSLSVQAVDQDGRELSTLPDGGGILALWHQDLPICTQAFANQNIHVMVSASRDGTMLARLAESLGYTVSRGSSSKGHSAVRDILHSLEQGQWVGMALDGPRGPARVAKSGASWLQAQSGKPLYMLVPSYSNYVRLTGWDATIFPIPFSHGKVRLALQNLSLRP